MADPATVPALPRYEAPIPLTSSMTLYLHSAMNTHPTAPHQQLDAQLTGILTRVEHLRTLHLTAEIGLEQALDESRRALGALAQYRHSLQRALQAAAVVLIFLLAATPAQAQLGQSAVVLLKIEPESRAADMGHASVALADLGR